MILKIMNTIMNHNTEFYNDNIFCRVKDQDRHHVTVEEHSMYATSATECRLEGACVPEVIPMDASNQWRTRMQINSSTTEGTLTYSLRQSINLSIN